MTASLDVFPARCEEKTGFRREEKLSTEDVTGNFQESKRISLTSIGLL